MKWEKIAIRDIAKIHYGKALKSQDRVESGSIPVYGSSGQVGNHIGALVKHPTLIIGRKGSVGSVTYAEQGGWPIDTVFYTEFLEPQKVSLRYFFYALRQAHLDRWTITTSIPGLNRDDLYATKIPLPPLEEQRRIAAILDKADEVRRKRQEAIRLTEELLRSLFLDMFGDLFSFIKPNNKIHSKGFQECSLGDQITLQRGFDITQKQCEEGPYPVISSGGISAYHSEAKAKGPGVILGRKGSVGRVHYVENDYWPHDTTLWVKEFRKNNPIFVYYFFQKFPIYHFEESTSNPTLNRNRLHPLKVFWPDLKAQEKFANAVKAVINYQVDERKGLEKADNLFNSLLQRAFRGEL